MHCPAVLCDWWNTLRWSVRHALPRARRPRWRKRGTHTSGQQNGSKAWKGWSHSNGAGSGDIHSLATNGVHAAGNNGVHAAGDNGGHAVPAVEAANGAGGLPRRGFPVLMALPRFQQHAVLPVWVAAGFGREGLLELEWQAPVCCGDRRSWRLPLTAQNTATPLQALQCSTPPLFRPW